MKYVVALLVFLASASPILGSEIIPEAFPIRDTSRYTIRYLSEGGNDTTRCLSNQTYPADPQNNNTQHCESLTYALTGGNYFRSRNVSNLIVVILPGSYSMGVRGIEIYNSQNIILTKMPNSSGEAIIKCDRHLEDNYNNFFIVNATNFALNGVVFTRCGSYSTPVRLLDSRNAVISNCTFRLVTKWCIILARLFREKGIGQWLNSISLSIKC